MTVLGCNFWFVRPPITVSEQTGLTACGAVLLNEEPVPAMFLSLEQGSVANRLAVRIVQVECLREYGALVLALNAFATPTENSRVDAAFIRSALAC
jgi:hypothetical protein